MKARAKAGSHALPDAEYAELLARQGGGCAICGKKADERTGTGAWRCRQCHKWNSAKIAACGWCANERPSPRRLHVDRDHRTLQVRGLLCMRCNRALPAWITPEWLIRAAWYIDPQSIA